MKNKITKLSKLVIKRVLLVFAILILWSIGSKHANPIFVPAPSRVFEDLALTLKDGSLWLATIYSLRRIALATILSTIISLPIGLLIFNVSIASDILAPIAAAMRALQNQCTKMTQKNTEHLTEELTLASKLLSNN